MSQSDIFIVFIAMIGGAIRVSTPFMFVALGECLTEKSGRINLGLEGNLVLGAMVAFAGSYTSGSPWLGVLFAGLAGLVLGAMHGYICKLPKVNCNKTVAQNCDKYPFTADCECMYFLECDGSETGYCRK